MFTSDVKNASEWSAMDLLDLRQSLHHGYGLEDVARCLGRDIEAVRLKTQELEIAALMGRDR